MSNIISNLEEFIWWVEKWSAIFSGTFDPPHQDHINIALEAINSYKDIIESVIIIPHNRNANKNPVDLYTRINWIDHTIKHFIKESEVSHKIYICWDINLLLYNTLDNFRQLCYYNEKIYRIIWSDKNIEKMKSRGNNNVLQINVPDNIRSKDIRCFEVQKDDINLIQKFIAPKILEEINNKRIYKNIITE